MELLAVVELMTQVATLVAYASGIPPCWHMYKTGSTRGVPYYFFLLNGTNNILSIFYGTFINNKTIFYLSLVGVVLNTSYSVIYIRISSTKSVAVKQLVTGICWICGVGCYMNYYLQSPELIVYQLGLLLCIMTSVLLVSPVMDIAGCVRRGSGADMSLAVVGGNAVCSVLWLSYGMLLGDFFIYAPNVLGVATCAGQLAVFLTYKTDVKSKNE